MNQPEKVSRNPSIRVSHESLARIKQLQIEWELPNQQRVIDKLIEIMDESKKEKPQKTTMKIERDLEGMSDEQLQKLKGEDAINEKIRRAFEKIKAYNDAQTENKNRWYVGNQTLRSVSGCNGKSVSVWLEKFKGGVDDHNGKYSMSLYHNKCHAKIEKVENLETLIDSSLRIVE